MSLGSNNAPKVQEASEVSYSNATSGLAAQNAQAALDELAERIEALKTEIISGGEITANFAGSDGTELLESSSGEQLLVYRKL